MNRNIRFLSLTVCLMLLTYIGNIRSMRNGDNRNLQKDGQQQQQVTLPRIGALFNSLNIFNISPGASATINGGNQLIGKAQNQPMPLQPQYMQQPSLQINPRIQTQQPIQYLPQNYNQYQVQQPQTQQPMQYLPQNYNQYQVQQTQTQQPMQYLPQNHNQYQVQQPQTQQPMQYLPQNHNQYQVQQQQIGPWGFLQQWFYNRGALNLERNKVGKKRKREDEKSMLSKPKKQKVDCTYWLPNESYTEDDRKLMAQDRDKQQLISNVQRLNQNNVQKRKQELPFAPLKEKKLASCQGSRGKKEKVMSRYTREKVQRAREKLKKEDEKKKRKEIEQARLEYYQQEISKRDEITSMYVYSKDYLPVNKKDTFECTHCTIIHKYAKYLGITKLWKTLRSGRHLGNHLRECHGVCVVGKKRWVDYSEMTAVAQIGGAFAYDKSQDSSDKDDKVRKKEIKPPALQPKKQKLQQEQKPDIQQPRVKQGPPSWPFLQQHRFVPTKDKATRSILKKKKNNAIN